MTALISIWREHAKGETFGQFIANALCMSPDSIRSDIHPLETLENATHEDLVRWARERFGIEE